MVKCGAAVAEKEITDEIAEPVAAKNGGLDLWLLCEGLYKWSESLIVINGCRIVKCCVREFIDQFISLMFILILCSIKPEFIHNLLE